MAGLILDTPPSPWMLSVVGLVALILGLLIVIWPRKANEVIWRSNQAFRPWRVRKPPFGFAVAFGCLLLVVAAAMFYGTWATIHS
jgi:hypothetical protein